MAADWDPAWASHAKCCCMSLLAARSLMGIHDGALCLFLRQGRQSRKPRMLHSDLGTAVLRRRVPLSRTQKIPVRMQVQMPAPRAMAKKEQRSCRASCLCHHIGEEPHLVTIATTRAIGRAGLCFVGAAAGFARAALASSRTSTSLSTGGAPSRDLRRFMALLAASTRVLVSGCSAWTWARNARTTRLDCTAFRSPWRLTPLQQLRET